MKILFVNACMRENSRTLLLAEYLLNGLSGEVAEINLQKENIAPLNNDLLAKRDKLINEGIFEHPMLRYAQQFANADTIVIAAPYWDLSFPSALKVYLEAITVSGITFQYIHGIPKGMCNAKQLIYITTSGGTIFSDFGYSYIKTLSEKFYGIKETICFKAEGLDIKDADIENVLEKTKQTINKYINKD